MFSYLIGKIQEVVIEQYDKVKSVVDNYIGKTALKSLVKTALTKLDTVAGLTPTDTDNAIIAIILYGLDNDELFDRLFDSLAADIGFVKVPAGTNDTEEKFVHQKELR